MDECRIALLRPKEIQQRLNSVPVVYIPVAPLEWHGPHLPFGVDPFNAEAASLGACQQTGGLVWPTQFWGTERERSPEVLTSLGLDPDSYVVGMDFPKNSLPSAYCPEEVFGLLLRELLRQVLTLGARLAVLVNGHGGVNHIEVLKRMAVEFSNTTDLRVHVRMAAPLAMLEDGDLDHAGSFETALMMYEHPETVDIAELPPLPAPLSYGDYAIVDHEGFTCQSPDSQVGGPGDPRTDTTPELGKQLRQKIVSEMVAEVEELKAAIRT